MIPVRRRRTGQLRHEDRDPFHLLRADDLCDAPAELRLPAGQRLVVVDVAHAPDGLADQRKGRASAHGIGARVPDRDAVVSGAHAPQPLLAQAALAHARLGEHEHGACEAFVDDLGQGRIERGELTLAAHAGGRDAEQAARLVGAAVDLAEELERAIGRAHLETSVQEPGGHLVDVHRRERVTNRA